VTRAEVTTPVASVAFGQLERIGRHRCCAGGSASLFLLDIEGLNFASLPYPPPPTSWSSCRKERERPMLDLGLMVFGLAFFALSIGYALACDRL
jgi:hypothetical protein